MWRNSVVSCLRHFLTLAAYWPVFFQLSLKAYCTSAQETLCADAFDQAAVMWSNRLPLVMCYMPDLIRAQAGPSSGE